MNYMANVRFNAYVKGVGNIMKQHEGQSKEAASSAAGKHLVKRGLGAGGGCLR